MNCPKCGAPVSVEDAFCPNCGAPLRAPTAVPSQVIAPTGTPRRSQPVVLILITILTALHGLALLFVFSVAFIFGLGIEVGGGAAARAVGSSFAMPVGIALVIYALLWLGVSFLGAAYGLYTFQSWAPMLAVVVWALFILAIFIMLLAGGVVMGILEMATAGFAIYYLLRPEVRELYV